MIAIDARTGDLIWLYEHEMPEDVIGFHYTNRGVALFGDKVFMATLDARIVALDAATGEVVWSESVAGQFQRILHDARPAHRAWESHGRCIGR